MVNPGERGRKQWTRVTGLLLLFIVTAGLLATPRAWAGNEPAVASVLATSEDAGFFVNVFNNLFNSRGLMNVLGQPEYTMAAFVVLNLIIFTETGLFFGFFLPGDSLLVTAGMVCLLSGWNLPLLLVTLCLSAIVGDSLGYAIGWHTGPKIFCREKSFFFNKDHLLRAHEFYEKHGGKTIILARFMPIIRTFAPVVAGVGKMEYRKFVAYNVVGGIAWVLSMVLFGYFLPTLIDPPLQKIFGQHFEVRDHIEKVILLVVFLSISPGIFLWIKNKLKSKEIVSPNLVNVGK